MAGSMKVHAAVLNHSHMHGVRIADASYAIQGALRSRREDPSVRFQRDLGRALWLAFAIVVLWIHAS